MGEEQDRPDIAEPRDAWRAEQEEMSRGRSVFIDETGASTKLARRHGRCRHGQRFDVALPHGRRTTTTFVDGLTNRCCIAPYVLDGAMDGKEAMHPICGGDGVSGPRRGWLGLVRRCSMPACAQASSKAWQRKVSPASIIRLMSAGDQPSPVGSVKCVPLSVSTVWTR
jgi:hypothetical protein